MNEATIDALALVKASITGETAKLSEQPDWNQIYQILSKGKLVPIVYRTVSLLEGEVQVPAELLKNWQAVTFSAGFRQLQSTHELRGVLTEAEARNIRLILFKGITLAALYPEPNMRVTSDADVLVTKEQRADAEKLLMELGYSKHDEFSKEHVPVYIKRKNGHRMVIELHDLLWEDYEGKQAEILESMKLDEESTLICQKACDLNVCTLGYEEHLVYQIFHMAKHFFFEGIALRYLVDIALYINAYADKIDFKRVRECIRKLHYDKFFCIILKICYEFLGMKVNVLGKEMSKTAINEHFIEDLVNRERQNDSVKQWETINFLSTYFMRTSVAKESTFQQRRKQFLPLPSELNDRYGYAKKCWLLLPVAWVHRVIYMISYSRHCKRNGFATSASIEKAMYRLDLMRELGMAETDKDIQDMLE